MTSTNTVIDRREIVEATERIEPLPASVSRLLQIVSDPNYDRRQVVDVVTYDPALAGDLLRRANSASAASRSTVADVGAAITRVGTQIVVGLALKRAAHSRLSQALPSYGLDAQDLWLHAMAASVAADVIREKAPVPIPAHAGTAALIHDVGKTVIADCLPPNLVDVVMTTAADEGLATHEAERAVFGIDHAEVGALVARTWGLPPSVQIAVNGHHQVDGADSLTVAVVAADVLAKIITTALEGDDEDALYDASGFPLPDALPVAWARCGFSIAEIADVGVKTAARFAELRSVYASA